jgi:hypothetical protein
VLRGGDAETVAAGAFGGVEFAVRAHVHNKCLENVAFLDQVREWMPSARKLTVFP